MGDTELEYDSVFFVSFGGPEQRADVMPFLENVVRGKKVPPERLKEVAAHYNHFEGKSPINDQNRALIAAIDERRAPDLRYDTLDVSRKLTEMQAVLAGRRGGPLRERKGPLHDPVA